MSAQASMLTVSNLRTEFQTEQGLVRAVDGISFAISRRQTFALVGESGCGKSITALSIMRLVPRPAGRIADGRIVLDGRDLLSLSETEMRQVRGGKIAMIFQEPMTSLNPVFTIGNQMIEAIRLHQKVGAGAARELAIQMLQEVGIPAPEARIDEYPHQLSGGMRQRVMIAMALSCNPQLLIADEPTTALDVTIQAQILDLLVRLKSQRGLGILLITHDLAVVAETADVVGVMYASKMAELAAVGELFSQPLHPYTQGLFRSLPRLGDRKRRLETIGGNVPSPLNFPTGCKFHPRCPLTRQLAQGRPAEETTAIDEDGSPVRVLARCAGQEPELREVRPRHWCACWECPGFGTAVATDPSQTPLG